MSNSTVFQYNTEPVIQTIENQRKWMLQDIRETPFCEQCKKPIMKNVWSMRKCHLTFCTEKCLDEYSNE
jgi:hypothetical protein